MTFMSSLSQTIWRQAAQPGRSSDINQTKKPLSRSGSERDADLERNCKTLENWKTLRVQNQLLRRHGP
jgi:hypothetical protein